MSQYKNRKNIFVKQSLDGFTYEFPFNVDIPFNASEIIIKQFVIYNKGTDDCYTLRWDGVNDLFFFGGTDSNSNLEIRINTVGKQLSGQQTFSIRDGTNSMTTAPRGTLAFIFEAVEY